MTQRVLITGGNKGIGLAATKLFVALGFEVISVGRSIGEDKTLQSTLVRQIPFDLTQIDEIPKLVASIGPVDILVNNAGMMTGLTIDQYTPELQQQIMRLNLEAPIVLIREVSRTMMACKHGRIVNNASIAGQIGHPDIWYGITKSGILNATKSFAKSLGPQGIQVNAVAVSPVETEMLQYIAEERRNLFLATTTEKRFATSDEVAKTMVWLATEAPPYLNGACIDLNSAAYVR